MARAEKAKKYLNELKRRGKESHVYRKYQLVGLEISQILSDEKHKALYIKLAKEMNESQLMSIAKDVASRADVKNKGAYFMSVLAGMRDDAIRAREAAAHGDNDVAKSKKNSKQ